MQEFSVGRLDGMPAQLLHMPLVVVAMGQHPAQLKWQSADLPGDTHGAIEYLRLDVRAIRGTCRLIAALFLEEFLAVVLVVDHRVQAVGAARPRSREHLREDVPAIIK